MLRHAGIADAGTLERVPGASNEIWFAGPYVLRISTAAHTSRLRHEAAVADALPDAVLHPGVVAHGRMAFGEWLIVRRRPGQVLSRAWADMREIDRQRAVSALGHILAALHETDPRAAGVSLDPPFLRGDSLECPHQLPPGRLLRLVERARLLPHMDVGVLDAAAALIRQASDALGPDDERTLVHGDLHFENVLWDGERVTAVLDFEWARPGPADLDLEVMLRFCSEPALHVSADYVDLVLRDEYRKVPTWLRAAHPAMFSHPRIGERLALYALAYDIRALLLDPPTAPMRRLSPHHPLLRIRMVVEGRSHASWIEW